MDSMTTLRPQLRDYQEAGVVALADVHTAVRVCALAGETDERVLLALAVAVGALRHGSVCLELNRFRDVALEGEDVDAERAAALAWPSAEELVAALRVSPLATGSRHGPLRPLTLVDSDAGWLLYLDRYFKQEQLIRRSLVEREASRPFVDAAAVSAALGEFFVDDHGGPTPAPDRQRIAAAVAATEWTTIVSGGPGTGKTHTVARILALLYRVYGPQLRVALAAPTGKAAAALTESVAEQAGSLGLPAGLSAKTVHRLLGWRRGSSSRFGHDAHHRLPYDVVVVDETSMVSLTLMARLLEALPSGARLILMGDPDQLTSVDAGAVLADLVHRGVTRSQNEQLEVVAAADLGASGDSGGSSGGGSSGGGESGGGGSGGGEPPVSEDERRQLSRGIVRLTRGRRFNVTIASLADAVRQGRVDDALAVLLGGDDAVSLHPPDDIGGLRGDVAASGAELIAAAEAGDVPAALGALRRHRLLCAHREGWFGRRHWAELARAWTASAVGHLLDPSRFYPGQPLLVTANDYEAQVFNGDIGVVVAVDGGLGAAIERARTPMLVHPTALSSVQTAYAMTIHRSQGSQYRGVSVVLPEADSPLLTRQLLYTAITRAQDRVRIVGTQDAVVAAVERQVLRASGLRRTFEA
jgi:exodeoxyribonuclease V alpha subunit